MDLKNIFGIFAVLLILGCTATTETNGETQINGEAEIDESQIPSENGLEYSEIEVSPEDALTAIPEPPNSILTSVSNPTEQESTRIYQYFTSQSMNEICSFYEEHIDSSETLELAPIHDFIEINCEDLGENQEFFISLQTIDEISGTPLHGISISGSVQTSIISIIFTDLSEI